MNARNYYSIFKHEPDILTVPDVVRLLRMGKNTVYKLIKEGSINSIKQGKKIIILMSDGYNNAGTLLVSQATKLAQKQNIAVYTIGIGTARQNKTSFLGLLAGDEMLGWDETTLKKIAKETGGKYFRAGSTKDLVDVYREIDRLETINIERKGFKPKRELFYYPLLIGLVFWLLGQRKRRRS